MAVNLNLLPPGLIISKSLGNALKTTKAIGVILTVAFLIFSVGIGAFYLLSTITLKNTNQKLSQLKTQVLAQQSSEQQLIILKDRLAKISSVKSSTAVLKNISDTNSLLNEISGDSPINQMSVETKTIDLTINIKTNEDLTKLLQNAESSSLFKSIILTSFGYNPNSAYVVGLNLTK